MKKIGFCGNHCEYCFFTECDGCKSNNPSCSYANLFNDKKCPNVLCCKSKNINGCWQCNKVKECNVGFFNSGENDAKAYAVFIHKYGTVKYTETIINLISKGYNYPRQFKNINNIEKIIKIFEKGK